MGFPKGKKRKKNQNHSTEKVGGVQGFWNGRRPKKSGDRFGPHKLR